VDPATRPGADGRQPQAADPSAEEVELADAGLDAAGLDVLESPAGADEPEDEPAEVDAGTDEEALRESVR
jgi:hypothetical protein